MLTVIPCKWPAAATALLLLAACAAPQSRPQKSGPTPTTSAPTTKPLPTPSVEPPDTQAEAPDEEESPWLRMRTRFSMPGCDYHPEVMKWAARYTQTPERFAASWRPAMPFLLLALDEVEKRNLPGEFVLLPYVESTYRPIPSQGQRPAGMWQLMPQTAIDRGLHISDDFDGRLDAIHSTRVALGLIERYDREFGDWRLATMAFNSGEYRVKRELGRRTAGDLRAEELNRFGVSATTHEHLYKLLALSCIISDPERFKVDLPEPDADDYLVAHPLDTGIDLRLVARFANVPPDKLRDLNASWLGNRMPDAAPKQVLIPRNRVDDFLSGIEAVPAPLHRDWKSQRLQHATLLPELAAASQISAETLAAVNDVDIAASIAAGSEILIPGREAVQRTQTSTKSKIHVIRAGDTLSAIARRYDVRISDLQRWNQLRPNAVLRLGARLRLSAPG